MPKISWRLAFNNVMETFVILILLAVMALTIPEFIAPVLIFIIMFGKRRP